jgi:hypothetical protein
VRIATRLGIFGALIHSRIAPKVTQIIMNTSFRMFPDSAAATSPQKGRRSSACRLAGRGFAPANSPRKYKLNFPLLADTDRTMAKAYGVAGSGLFGVARALTGMNERVTFIIDEKGRVAHVLDDPNCPNHGEEVLKLL